MKKIGFLILVIPLILLIIYAWILFFPPIPGWDFLLMKISVFLQMAILLIILSLAGLIIYKFSR